MKILLILMLLKAAQVQAQERWWKPTKKEWLTYPLFALSGTAKAYHEATAHYKLGKGNEFVDIKLSFTRKYKDFAHGDFRAKYFGSKTFLVWTTDFLHLTSMIDVTSFGTGVAINFADIKQELKLYPKRQRWLVIGTRKIAYPMLIRALIFEGIFKSLNIK